MKLKRFAFKVPTGKVAHIPNNWSSMYVVKLISLIFANIRPIDNSVA